VHKAKKGARLLQTCDKVSAFSQGLWGRDLGGVLQKDGGAVLGCGQPKKSAGFGVDRNNHENIALRSK
jgi:hypothetical protein